MSLWNGRRGEAWLIVAVSVLVLAGCTGGTPVEPETSTPPAVVTPSATPTPTPTETPAIDVTVKPERPAALDEPPSVEGAVAVAEYFLLLFPYVNATGDLADWRTLSQTDCVFCTDVTARVEAKLAAGRHDEGGGLSITTSGSTEVNPGHWYSARVDFFQEPSVTVDATGTVVTEFPNASDVRADLSLIWENGGWLVREVATAELPS